MVKKVIGQKGFWKSVGVLGIVYAAVLAVLLWAMRGFASSFFTPKLALVALISGLIVSFSTTYGKFWRKLKEDEYKNS